MWVKIEVIQESTLKNIEFGAQSRMPHFILNPSNCANFAPHRTLFILVMFAYGVVAYS